MGSIVSVTTGPSPPSHRLGVSGPVTPLRGHSPSRLSTQLSAKLKTTVKVFAPEGR